MGMMKRQRPKPCRKGCNYISRKAFDYVDGMENANFFFFFSNLGEVGGYHQIPENAPVLQAVVERIQ